MSFKTDVAPYKIFRNKCNCFRTKNPEEIIIIRTSGAYENEDRVFSNIGDKSNIEEKTARLRLLFVFKISPTVNFLFFFSSLFVFYSEIDGLVSVV